MATKKKATTKKKPAKKTPAKKTPKKKKKAAKKKPSSSTSTSSRSSSTTVREALEALILEVMPQATKLAVGNAHFFWIPKGNDEQSVCGTKVQKGVVGLQLPALATYDDPDKRLVGKGPAGRTLWLDGLDDVEFARGYVEAAHAWAKG